LVHCVWISEDDIRILAESGVSVVTCPSSNLRLKSGIAPVNPLLRAGVNVGIGMDGITINDEEDMFQEMRLVRNLHRVPGHGEACPEGRNVFRMATEGGARAAGLWDVTGSIGVGKSADLVLMRLDEMVTPFMRLPDELIDVLVLRGRPRYVETVMVGGEVLYHEGRHVSGEPGLIREEIIQSAQERAGKDTKGFQQLMEQVRPCLEEYYRGWNPPSPDPHYRFNGRSWGARKGGR
jgi:cytosine/adenosine deaminase-related metal-dependent hydrolase